MSVREVSALYRESRIKQSAEEEGNVSSLKDFIAGLPQPPPTNYHGKPVPELQIDPEVFLRQRGHRQSTVDMFFQLVPRDQEYKGYVVPAEYCEAAMDAIGFGGIVDPRSLNWIWKTGNYVVNSSKMRFSGFCRPGRSSFELARPLLG